MNRRTTKRYGFAKLAAGAVALLLLGVFASGALADGDPFSPLGVLTGSTTTSSDATGASSTSSDTTGTSTDGQTTATEPTTTETTTATSSSSTSALSPSITTDKSDYPPGSTVTLTGAGWGAGESVHVVVNDTVGATWQYTSDVLADPTGGFTLQIQLASYFVSDYDVTATGAAGEVATAAFTDANVSNATLSVRQSDCTTVAASFISGETACVHSVVSVQGGGTLPDYLVQWVNPSGVLTFTDTHNSVADNQAFDDSHLVAAAGTWTVKACKSAGCSGGNLVSSATFTVAAKQNQTITFTQPTTPQSYGNTFNITPTSDSGLAVSVGSTGPCTVAAGAGSSFDVTMTSGSGNCVLTASQAGNAQFNAAPTVQRTVVAQTRAVTATADPKTRVYGNGDPVLTFQVTSGSLAGADTFSGSLTRAAGESVGPYAIQKGTLALSSNYTLTYVGANLTITQRPITVSADAKSKVYGNADPALTYQLTSGTLAFSDSISGALTRAAGESVGQYDITQGTVSAGGNYNLTFVGAKLSVTKRSVEITADAKSKVYGSADPALTYQVTSGSLAFSDAFSGALSRAVGESVAGSPYAITQGTVALNGNYDLSYVGANLSISKRPVAITADAKSKTYGDADPALTYQITSGSLAFSDAFSGALSRAGGESVAGSPYAILQGSVTLGGNYELSYVGANLSISKRLVTITADAKSKVYGNADPALTYQITSGSLAFSDGFSGSLSRDAGESVTGGPYAITQGSVTVNVNYDLSFVGANFTISKRPVEITADAKNKTYGDADPALTYQISSGSLAFADAFSGSLSRAAGESVAGGPYAITQGSVTLGGNYDLSYVGANLTITKATLSINADSKTKVYGDANPTATYSFSGFQFSDNGSNSGISGSADCSYAFGSGPNVGSYPGAISCGHGSLTAGNYDFAGGGKGELSITKRPVTITADGKSKTYGDADPALTYHITSGSLAFSDAFSGSLSRAGGESVAGSPYSILQGTLTLGGNYDLSFVGANFTISKRPVTITADGKSKTYGDADPALTYHITSGSLAFSDAFSGSLSRAGGESVAGSPYSILQGTLTLGGNYDLSFVGANFTISKRSVEITADAESKVYGNADPALTYQITSGSLAFSDAFSGALSRAAGENVGDYAITQGTVALNGNYDLSYVGANLSVTKRPVEITADAESKVYGNADPALTYQITSGSLAFSDAFSGALSRAAGENVGDYAITQGTVALNGNYDLSYVGANLTITKATLSINADSKTKVYGDANPTASYSFNGFQFSDNASNSGITGSAACSYAFGSGPNVGSYPGAISCGPGDLAAVNYDFAGGGKGDLSITKRPVEITADAKTKTYGNADPALTYQITSGTLAFSDAFSGSLSRVAGESVAGSPYAILKGSVTLGGNYELSYVGADLSITTRPVTITADAKSKVYGNADPALTYQITTGTLAFSDAFSGSLSRAAGETVAGGPYAILQGSVTLGGNYDLSYVGANFTISKRPVTITADAKSKVYGNADPALTYQITTGTLAFSDAFSGSLSRVTGESVAGGPYAITQGTVTLGGNYDLSYVGANFTITKKPITGSFTADNKPYDGGVSAVVLTETPNGVLAGDMVTLTGGTAAFMNKNVGTGKVVTLTGATLAGLDAGNYNLTSVGTTTANVTAKGITGSFTAQSKVYDGNVSAVVLARTPNGVVSGDTVTLGGGTAAFDNKNVGTGKNVTLTGATLGGGDSGNYSLTSVDTTLADITKAPLTVTADNQAMLLNATVPPLTYKMTGFVGGDTVAVVTGAAACSTGNGTAVGTFDIVCTVGTLSAQNYSFPVANFVKGKLTVTFQWEGFLQPINDTAHTGLYESKFKLGQTIPAKFVLKNAQGVVVQQSGTPTFTRSNNNGVCDATAVPDQITDTVAPDPNAVYAWDGSQYHYNWSTKGLTAGEYRIYANLADGTKQYVDICLS